MKQFIFYTTEGYTYSPNSQYVENCQILAFELAENRDIAIDLFKTNCADLIAQGFSIEKIVCKEIY